MHVLAFGVLVSLVSTSPVASQPREDADRAELTRLERVWNDAHARGDAEALDRLWADELTVTVAGMRVMSKADAMAMTRSGRMKFLRYDTSDLRIQVYGDAAVVTGRLQRARLTGGKEISEDWRFTKVYVRRTGAWRVVAWHASPASQ